MRLTFLAGIHEEQGAICMLYTHIRKHVLILRFSFKYTQ